MVAKRVRNLIMMKTKISLEEKQEEETGEQETTNQVFLNLSPLLLVYTTFKISFDKKITNANVNRKTTIDSMIIKTKKRGCELTGLSLLFSMVIDCLIFVL